MGSAGFLSERPVSGSRLRMREAGVTSSATGGEAPVPEMEPELRHMPTRRQRRARRPPALRLRSAVASDGRGAGPGYSSTEGSRFRLLGGPSALDRKRVESVYG